MGEVVNNKPKKLIYEFKCKISFMIALLCCTGVKLDLSH